MTSKNSSSAKRPAYSISQKEYLKRRLWPAGLAFVLLFLIYVVGPVILLTQVRNGYDPQDALLTLRDSMGQNYGSYLEDAVGAVFASVIGVVLALQGYSYLHDRKAVDFYESQPISRKAHFIGLFLNSLLIYLAAYILTMLIGVLVGTSFGAVSGEILVRGVLGSFVRDLGVYLASFALGTLAAMLTGNAVVSVLAVCVFFGYELLLTIALRTLESNCFRSYVPSPGFGIRTLRLSPVGNALGDLSIHGIAANLLLAAGVMALAYFAYTKRKNEAAGSAVIFQPVRTIVKIAIAVLGGILAAVVFWDVGSTVLCLFCAMLMVLIVCCVMEIIYHYDFKKLFARFPEMLLAMALTMLVTAVFRYDLTGFDRWVPKAESIRSAAVYTGYNTSYLNESGKWLGQNEFEQEYMKLIDTESVVDLVQSALRYTDENGWENGDTFTVLYRLKNGREIKRSYPLPREDAAVINAVTDSEEYRTGSSQIWHDGFMGQDTVKLFYQVPLQEWSEGKTVSYEEFREVYRRDLSKLCYNYVLEHPVLGIVTVWSGASGRDERELNYTLRVYDGFDETIAFLKENGLWTDSSVLDESKIEKLQLFLWSVSGWDGGEPEQNPNSKLTLKNIDGDLVLELTDKEQIREALTSLDPGDYDYTDPLLRGDLDFNIGVRAVYLEDAYAESDINLYLRKGAMPAFVREAFGRYWYIEEPVE